LNINDGTGSGGGGGDGGGGDGGGCGDGNNDNDSGVNKRSRREAYSGVVAGDRYIRGDIGDNDDGGEDGSGNLDFCARDSSAAAVDAVEAHSMVPVQSICKANVSGDGDICGDFGDSDDSEDGSTGLDFCTRDSCVAAVDVEITACDDRAAAFGPSPGEGAILVGSDRKKKKKRGPRGGKQDRLTGDQRKTFVRARDGDDRK
jgi:hypothetical protein